MFISDAIRAGSKLSSQVRRKYVHMAYGKHLQSCALGAACIGIGKRDLYSRRGDAGIRQQWPELDTPVQFPVNATEKADLDKYQRHLNPDQRYFWRERWEEHARVRHAQSLTLYDCIIALNDDFFWSREDIADWIDTLELRPAILEMPHAVLELPPVTSSSLVEVALLEF